MEPILIADQGSITHNEEAETRSVRSVVLSFHLLTLSLLLPSFALATDFPGRIIKESSMMVEQEEIKGIYVILNVEGVPALLVLLALDGSINRMGTGAVDNTEMGMFIGVADPALFLKMRSQVTADLLQWIGARADPQPKGKVCELTIGFMLANGKEQGIQFKYGSESLGPPPEVRRFVTAMVEARDPWYEDFKAKTAK